METTKVALIFGAGPNIGRHVADALSEKGYKVALASRTNHGTDQYKRNQIHIPIDLTRPENVPGVFDQVKNEFGTFPSVVVYNGKFDTPPSFCFFPNDKTCQSITLSTCYVPCSIIFLVCCLQFTTFSVVFFQEPYVSQTTRRTR